MMKLTCTAMECVNNSSGLCTAKKIKVIGEYTHYGSNTHCYTFGEKVTENTISNASNINFLGEMVPNVDCTAEECYYNKNRICGANSIMVSGGATHSMDGTACETYEERR